MASLSLALSVAAFFLSGVAILYAYKRHVEERKPVLIFDEKEDDNDSRSFDTMVINIGKGPALNIREASWTPIDSPLVKLGEITRNLASTSETQRRTTFRSGLGRLITLTTHWEVQYEDLEGRVYRTVLRGTRHRFERLS